MHQYRGVLFDLDGTLLDTALDFYWVADRMRAERGLEPVERSSFRQYVSDGARAMVGYAFSLPVESAEIKPLVEEFLDLYTQHMMVESRLFAGIDVLLDWLDSQRIRWGIVTNKPERFSRPILDQLGLSARCASLICPEQVSKRKPDPEALLLASRELECPAQETLYIGDHQRDIEAGRRAGMITIACQYGYLHTQDDPRLWHSDHLVRDTRELAALLECLYGNSETAAY